MFKFITNKSFWVNLLVAAGLAVLLIFLVLQTLGWITKHGEYLTVPGVKGQATNEAIKSLESKGFEVIIQDSIFTENLKRGTVIKQLPDADATVKVNRTVFLTVNRYVPPMISMPALEGKPLNYALALLEKNHLKLGDTTFRADFMRGSVIEQLQNGSRIAQGSMVQWGSRVSLVISGGLDENNMVVPNLTGLTYRQAKEQLDSLGILLNPVTDAGVRDTLGAFIYRQNPPHFDDDHKLKYIKPGMFMDIWLSAAMMQSPDSIDIKKKN